MHRFLPALSLAFAALAALATAAFADDAATNPAVLARMEAMKSIAAEVKALTGMARGEVEFDAGEVAARMEAIAARGGEIPALFEAPETDPTSEALPAIWASYPEFTLRASALVEAAKAGAGAADEFELEEAIGALGQACKACHGSFRLQP